MGPLVGVRDVAAHLAGAGGGQRGGGGERRRGGVSRLDLEAAVVDRPAVETGRGARLEAPHPERERTELLGEGIGRRIPGPSALVAPEPDVDPPPEKRPRGQHHCAGAEGQGPCWSWPRSPGGGPPPPPARGRPPTAGTARGGAPTRARGGSPSGSAGDRSGPGSPAPPGRGSRSGCGNGCRSDPRPAPWRPRARRSPGRDAPCRSPDGGIAAHLAEGSRCSG